MKTNTTTKMVKATISNAAVLEIFVQAIYGDAKNSGGKDQTFYRVLGSLVGIADVEAVKVANFSAKKENRITTDEFRKWLPAKFSEFARATLEENK